MGVFTVDDALRAAAIDAGHELGIFEALGAPLTLAELARRIDLRPTHRLVALVDALVAIGALVRTDDRIARGAIAPRSTQPLAGGWGAIATVVRSDTPLAISDADIARRYQRHLITASAPAARDVAAMLVAASTSLRAANDIGVRAIDIGSGAGAYSRALLVADPTAHVTLVDEPAVIELARVELADYAQRTKFIADDARKLEFGSGARVASGTHDARDARDAHDAGDAPGPRDARDARDAREADFDLAIVANVLHLHSAAACAELCATAARAVRPGGTVVIVDLRRGTLEGEMFALNMAVYTDGGSVYSVEQVSAWLRDAGLVAIEERRLHSAPEMVVVLARRGATEIARENAGAGLG